MKLVAILRPRPTGYQAQLVAGTGGCDPELRTIQAPDLPTVLAAAVRERLRGNGSIYMVFVFDLASDLSARRGTGEHDVQSDQFRRP